MSEENAVGKLHWQDPNTNKPCEYVLTEGATVSIGRSVNNDIQINEHHVSRQHAVIQYRDGMFMISDLGSSNGTYVNNSKVDEPFPLFVGDEIRLYIPVIKFLSLTLGDEAKAKESGFFITKTNPQGQGCLIVTNGPQEGQTIPLLLNQVTVGRAIEKASWEVMLQDASVSRPHARFEKRGDRWHIVDLGSANGTRVNRNPVDHTGYGLADGDTLELGRSILLFRTGWKSPEDRAEKVRQRG
jgi:pSer/pThr/pTyr-binding forkhead associated (FHA) protein